MAARRASRGVALIAQRADQTLAIGEIGVAAAVAAVLGRSGACNLVGGADPAGLGKVADDEIALGVDIGTDMVGDLSGVVAEADAAVEARRAEPARAPVPVHGFLQPRA